MTATDSSPSALDVARSNATRLGFGDRVDFIEGTWPRPGRWDLLVANLPYVPSGTILEPELASWEPDSALFAGPAGTEVIEDVLGELGHSGVEARVVGLEIGHDQGAEVQALVSEAGFHEVELRRDLAGYDRVVVGRMPGGDGLE